jgi:hypothetical protein
MPLRPEAPPPTRIRNTWTALCGLRLLPLLFLLAAWTAVSAGDDQGLAADGTERPPVKLSTLVEGGSTIAIASTLGAQPQIGAFRDLSQNLQVGLQIRTVTGGGSTGYDFLPQVDVSLRTLWLGDEFAEPVRNSEYFGLSAGMFFAYDFDGKKAGPRPYGTLSLGKYWMPFDNQPLGLDLNLELTRYFSGLLPERTELVYATVGIHVFYVIP